MIRQSELAILADLIQEGWYRVSGRRPTDESALQAAEFVAAIYPEDVEGVLDACIAGHENACNRQLSTLLLLLEEQRFPFVYEEETP